MPASAAITANVMHHQSVTALEREVQTIPARQWWGGNCLDDTRRLRELHTPPLLAPSRRRSKAVINVCAELIDRVPFPRRVPD